MCVCAYVCVRTCVCARVCLIHHKARSLACLNTSATVSCLSALFFLLLWAEADGAILTGSSESQQADELVLFPLGVILVSPALSADLAAGCRLGSVYWWLPPVAKG